MDGGILWLEDDVENLVVLVAVLVLILLCQVAIRCFKIGHLGI